MSDSNVIEIYWDDLTKEKQDEILEAFGENCNYDVFPIATIPVDTGEESEYFHCHRMFGIP